MIRYPFPLLDTVQPCLEAIAGREEFSAHIKDGPNGERYQVLDYHVNFHDTFPELTGDPVEDRVSILRRECRGLIVDPDSGEILSRAWHKFHNVNERPSTQADRIDLNFPHVLMEKLDGSMIRPFMARSGSLLWNAYPTRPLMWGTMAGVTDVAENARVHIEHSNVPYGDFARNLIEDGWTPIFEWCSRKNRIVVDHPVDQLVLTGVRHRRTGEYMIYELMRSRADAVGIPVVEVYDRHTDINALIEHTRGLDAAHEGYVVRFIDGHMLKIKADLYCRIHKTREHLIFEKNIIELILKKEIDDVLPDMPEADQTRVRAYSDSLLRHIYNRAVDLAMVVAQHAGADQKGFAMTVQNHPYRSLLFQIRKGEDPRDVLIQHVLKHTATQTRVDQVRDLIGPKWETF